LLETTPETHPDYQHVLKTFNKVNEIASHVNNITKNQTNLLKLSNFDESVTGFPGKMIDFMNTRTHVRDEILNQITIDFDHSRIKEDRRHLYVFNDIIVITKPQKKKKESFVIMFKTTDMKSVSPTKGETNLPQATPPHSIKISLRNKSDYYFNCLGGGVVINFIKDLQPLVVQAPDGADNTETPLLKESTDKKSKKVKTRVKAQTLKRGSIKAEDFKIMNNMESIKKRRT